MNAKVITEEVINSYGEDHAGDYDYVTKLAEDIKGLHTEISKKTDVLDTDKKILGSKSKDFFFIDVTKNEPEIVGNHEYHIEGGDKVTVNFKVGGKPFEQINGEPAYDILKGYFKEHTEDLFGKEDAIKVTAPDFRLLSQACDHPEIFDLSLKLLTHDQKMQLVKEHPEWVTVTVTDVTKYAEVYPADVDKKTYVTFKNGFIETLSKVDTIIKKAASGLIGALLKDTLQASVVCGNRSKK
jgi:hypothetical protein